jgi:hypothetical protein
MYNRILFALIAGIMALTSACASTGGSLTQAGNDAMKSSSVPMVDRRASDHGR